ncbi:MAG: hypothetical protein JSS49_13080 [Planctomycetes bacterium]|nr:hypothetical protein [Planctomycetota bacterium]
MDVTSRLPELAVKLAQKAQANSFVTSDLRDECSWLCRQIARDSATPGLFDFWGLSSNFDELANVSIVEPQILSAIGEIAALSMDGQGVHAGLQHTYGYLLSTVVTPYGFKRERWVSSSLEHGFGLPSDVLGPNPSQGTLLANATMFAGSIAFRGDKSATERLQRIAPFSSKAVGSLEYTQLPQTRIVETLALRDSAGHPRSVRICTDLVPFPYQVEGINENCLLVYSFEDSTHPGARLTTLFTVGPSLIAEVTDPGRFGTTVEIRTRFNACIPGLVGKTFRGQRALKRFRRSHRGRRD